MPRVCVITLTQSSFRLRDGLLDSLKSNESTGAHTHTRDDLRYL